MTPDNFQLTFGSIGPGEQYEPSTHTFISQFGADRDQERVFATVTMSGGEPVAKWVYLTRRLRECVEHLLTAVDFEELPQNFPMYDYIRQQLEQGIERLGRHSGLPELYMNGTDAPKTLTLGVTLSMRASAGRVTLFGEVMRGYTSDGFTLEEIKHDQAQNHPSSAATILTVNT